MTEKLLTGTLSLNTTNQHRDKGRPVENTENGRCVSAVWDNLKSRLLITDLPNNRSFGREGSFNRISFDFIRRT